MWIPALLVVVALALASTLAAVPAQAGRRPLSATLRGAAEVPGPGIPMGAAPPP